ncbi:arginine deiminase [Sporolactobacillus terrae]|uniref:Extradiol ring-cleavage dioxygenase LigAB LigA subunit domain-containing protein n=1 Tax=Sporolactobacillus terrae TaxID=269673 RepID=A0A5K7X1Y0_9BACL|nr:arginine deiminase [Sporolactobacillus terrae]BBO00005.1 hypothetical protein St703_27090 [Sporolactobacillus terrae]
MSNGFESLVDSLQSDYRLISKFLSNPQEILNTYKLSEEERDIFLNRDLDALTSLTGSRMVAEGALSGAHSSTCSCIVPLDSGNEGTKF